MEELSDKERPDPLYDRKACGKILPAGFSNCRQRPVAGIHTSKGWCFFRISPYKKCPVLT
jgi:hypothetical protein